MPMASRSAECLITFPGTPGNTQAGCSHSCWVPAVSRGADIPGSAHTPHLLSTFCFSLSAAGCSPCGARWPQPPMTSSSLKVSCPFDSRASGTFPVQSTDQNLGSPLCTGLPASLPSCCVTLPGDNAVRQRDSGPENDSLHFMFIEHIVSVTSPSANCSYERNLLSKLVFHEGPRSPSTSSGSAAHVAAVSATQVTGCPPCRL